MIHYFAAGEPGARTARLEGHEDGFREFRRGRFRLEDVLATAREVLERVGSAPLRSSMRLFPVVARSQLSESRRKLVYCYKLDFGAMKSVTASSRSGVPEKARSNDRVNPTREGSRFSFCFLVWYRRAGYPCVGRNEWHKT